MNGAVFGMIGIGISFLGLAILEWLRSRKPYN